MHDHTAAHIDYSSSLRILALESSGSVCSVALARLAGTEYAVELVAELSFFESHQHDSLLAASVEMLLQSVAWQADGIHAVCCSAGPGSFTGLRIGAALAKGLCFRSMDNSSGNESLVQYDITTRQSNGSLSIDELGSVSGPILVAPSSLYTVALHYASQAVLAGKSSLLVAITSHKTLVYCQRFALQYIQSSFGSATRLEVTAENTSRLMEFNDVVAMRQSTDFCCGTAFDSTHILTAAMLVQAAASHIAQGAILQGSAIDEFVPFYGQDFIPKIQPLQPFQPLSSS